MAETKFLDSAGLTHLLEKTNSKFSKMGHTHTKAEITDFAHNHNDLYYGKSEIDSKLNGKSNTGHTHDDRYYTETEMDSKLSGKANSSHTHTKSQITDFPSSMKNPNSLTISLNGTSQGAYDGSAAKSINVTPSSIGAATSGHTHNYAGSSSAGGSATKANGIVVSDTRNENSAPNDAAFDKNMLTADFKYGSKIGSPTGFNGTYCGVLSLAPWGETSGGHGYQLAFGYEKEGHPRLALRGSDLSATSWNSWYKVYTSDDKPTLSELGAASASHSHTKSQITDFAHTHDDRYYTESEIDTKLSGKAASSHKHAAADITSVNASAITGTIAAANLPSYVDDVLEKVQAHIANTTIHITAAERAKWNAKADITIGTDKPTSSTSGIFYIQTN